LNFKRLVDSFNYAISGLVHAVRTQRNMKIHLLMAFLVLIAAFFLEISKLDLILLLFSIVLVIAMELVNTAIEIVIDMVSREYRLSAKIAKNIAAAAVLIASINALAVGYLVFREKFGTFNLYLLSYINEHPSHIVLITMGLLLIVITIFKAGVGKGSPLQGGMPSGHSAIAFSLATMVILLTMDITIAALVLLIALLVVQSRLQTRTHNLIEVVTGALLGILLTTIIFYLISGF